MIVNGYRIVRGTDYVVVYGHRFDARYTTRRGSGAIARATAFARSQRPGPVRR
jgi:hypothetical protein